MMGDPGLATQRHISRAAPLCEEHYIFSRAVTISYPDTWAGSTSRRLPRTSTERNHVFALNPVSVTTVLARMYNFLVFSMNLGTPITRCCLGDESYPLNEIGRASCRERV